MSQDGSGRAPRPEHPLRSARSRRAVSWYLGAGISLIWLLSPLQVVLETSASTADAVVGSALLLLFALVFLASAPLQGNLPPGRRMLLPAVLLQDLVVAVIAVWRS